jgi:pyruvate,water dikinase
MNKVRNLSEICSKDVDLAGGKGASLGEMLRVGIPVPPGFVITTNLFQQFAKDVDLYEKISSISKNKDLNNLSKIRDLSEVIKKIFLDSNISEETKKIINNEFKKLKTSHVAVRSSATIEDGAIDTWAGQFESYLNITEKDLLEKIRLCWASFFTPRAIFYRNKKGFEIYNSSSMAVVVQKMVNGEKSGIAFSANPVTQDRNCMVIEASYGLGQSAVSGQIIPDRYNIAKKPEIKIINKFLSLTNNYNQDIGTDASILTNEQITELSELVSKIEGHFDFPCDIEWVLKNGIFYIVQCRPIINWSYKTK